MSETAPSNEALPEELVGLRKSIDNIDAALVHMLAERFKFTQAVGRLKAAQGLPPSDPEREKVQIASVACARHGRRTRPDDRGEVPELHRRRGHPPPRADRVHGFDLDCRADHADPAAVTRRWDPSDIPSQSGRVAVVTGAGRGIGYFIAESLARAGATVVITTRRPEQAAHALACIREHVAGADVSSIDTRPRLARLDPRGRRPSSPPRSTCSSTTAARPTRHAREPSPRTASSAPSAPTPTVRSRSPRCSSRSCRRMPASSGSAASARASRRPTPPTSSSASASTTRSLAYATSKHLDHAFAFELERRLDAAGCGIHSLLAHPGFALNAPGAQRTGITDQASRASTSASACSPR